MHCAMERIGVQIFAVKGHLVQKGEDCTFVVAVVMLEFFRQFFYLVQEAEEVLLHDHLALAQARFLKSNIIEGAQLGDKDSLFSLGRHSFLYIEPHLGGIILFGDNIHDT